MWVLQCHPRGDKMMAFRLFKEMTGRSLRQQSAGKKVLDEGAVHNGSTQLCQRRLYSQPRLENLAAVGLPLPPRRRWSKLNEWLRDEPRGGRSVSADQVPV
jgi:hypothetical protein